MIERWLDRCESVHLPANFKAFISQAQKLGYVDAFPNVTSQSLNKIKRRPSEYIDVITLDPTKGPWFPAERAVQTDAIEKAYGSGVWSAERYCLVQLLRSFGMRPQSLSEMKICNLTMPYLHEEGHEMQFMPVALRIPFAKNAQDDDIAPEWPLDPYRNLQNVMTAYLSEYIPTIEDDWENVPLFSANGLPGTWGKGDRTSKTKLSPLLDEFAGHATPANISQRFKKSMKRLGLSTNRLGSAQPMVFSSQRERHTVATRLALRGWSAQQIAMYLGHSSARSCEAYISLAVVVSQVKNHKFQQVGEEAFMHFEIAEAAVFNQPDMQEVLHLDSTIDRDFEEIEDVLVGAGSCAGCPHSVAGAEYDGNAFICLACSKFKVFEDANLEPLWQLVKYRQLEIKDENGHWTGRGDPKTFDDLLEAEAKIISAEYARRKHLEEKEVA